MRIAYTNQDGSLSITYMIPVAVIDNESGDVFDVKGTRQRPEAGVTVLWGSWRKNNRFEEIVVGDSSYNVFDLEEDHLPGKTIVFPDFEKDILAKHFTTDYHQPVVSWRRMDKSEVIDDRTFRDAWHDDGGKVKVHMGKAREMTRRRLREERAPLLSALDADYMKALEANDKGEQARIVAKKKKLRDAPASPDIDSAQTPDELKAIVLPS